MTVNNHLQSPYINSRTARLKNACLRCTYEVNKLDARLGAQMRKVRLILAIILLRSMYNCLSK